MCPSLVLARHDPFLNGQPLLSDLHLSHFQIQGEGQNSSTIRYKGVLGTITTLAKTEGLPKLYSGLPAGIQRQISFASLRIGLYDTVQEYFSSGRESKDGWGVGGGLCPDCALFKNWKTRDSIFVQHWLGSGFHPSSPNSPKITQCVVEFIVNWQKKVSIFALSLCP